MAATQIQQSLRVHLFGPHRITVDDAPLKLPALPKTLLLLAYLVLHNKGPVMRDAVAFALWEDDSEESARAALRRHLHLLQRALPASPRPWVSSDGDSLQWDPAAQCWVDVVEFERLVLMPKGRAAAVDLYTGDLLENLYDDWLFPMRERLRTSYLGALEALVTLSRSCRDFAAAASFAQKILVADPWREDALRQLMAVRYETGDRAGSLQVFADFKRRLREEMDVEPMPETLALRELVLRNAPLLDASAAGQIMGPDADVPLFGADARLRSGSALAPVALPFVGRDAELDRLVELWSGAARGKGSVVFIGGEAGIGKTRLAAELALRVENQGGRVIHGATGYPESAPYACIAAALRTALPIIAVLDVEPVWLAAVAQIVPELRARTPNLPDLLPTDPNRERLRLFEAIAVGMEALAKARPLLVVLEDLHWAGDATLSALQFIAGRVSQAPILVIVTYRREETARADPLSRLRRDLETARIASRVSPPRLTCQSVAQIVGGFERLRDQTAGLAATVHEQSEGNPLFVAQIIRDLLESQTAPDRTNQRSEDMASTPSWYADVRQTIAGRIARLTQPARALVEMAAIVGQGFDVEVLRELSGWDERQIDDALSELLDRYLVKESLGHGACAYAFTHHVIQGTAYDNIPSDVRTRRHRRVGRVLEDLFSDRSGEMSNAVARHYDLGGAADDASRCYLAAARHAIDLHADAEAGDLASRGLELASRRQARVDLLLVRERASARRGHRAAQVADLDELDRLREGDNDLACEIQSRRVLLARTVGDRDEEESLIAELRSRAEAANDPRRLAQATRAAATHAALVVRFDAALEFANAALSAARTQNEPAAEVECLCLLAHIATHRGLMAQAVEHLDCAVRVAESNGNGSLLARALWTASAEALMRHDFERCVDLCRKAMDLYRAIGDREGQADALARCSSGLGRLHRYEEARRCNAAAAEIFSDMGKRQGVATLMINRSIMAMRLGALEEATAALRGARTHFDHLKDLRGQIVCDINESFAAICGHDSAAAKKLALGAVAKAQTIGHPAYESQALCNLGAVESELGDFASAIEHMNAGLAIQETINRRADTVSNLADLALAYRRSNDVDAARRAADRMLEMGAEAIEDALWPQYCYWAAARAYRAPGKKKRSRELLERAYEVMSRFGGQLTDEAAKSIFFALPCNREISDAWQRGAWPP
ncbi:MAG: AAA family ATPase [Candidatus Eremiobacteraeota bacterium]|nr:AAA family ATPase [Candidatus Eremiobacteraeota bacterium]